MRQSRSSITLTDLNADCLLAVLNYLTEEELLCLCKTHKRLESFIEEYIFLPRTQDLLLCGQRNSPSINKRNHTRLSNYERILVARNWISGTYNQRPYFHHAPMFPTKICLDRDALFVSHAGYLRKYLRSQHDVLQRRYEKEISTPCSTDISHFVKKDDTVFAGRVCGSCFLYENDEVVAEQRMHSSNEYLYSVDFVRNMFATSTDSGCRLWERSEEFGMIHFDMVQKLDRGFKTLKLSDDGQWLYGGLYDDPSRQALRAIHVESGEEQVLDSRSMSIYDLKIKDDNVLLTANFDTTFRMFDRRVERDVAIWEDPFDSSFYCLEYDGLYAVLAGTSMHARVNLYDIRMPKYVQLYYPGRTRQHNGLSPVYSLACDSRYMFVATDHNLRVFDFKTSFGTSRDYSKLGRSQNDSVIYPLQRFDVSSLQ